LNCGILIVGVVHCEVPAIEENIVGGRAPAPTSLVTGHPIRKKLGGQKT